MLRKNGPENWADEEAKQAGTQTNTKVPLLTRIVQKAPERRQKMFTLQPKYHTAFNRLAFQEKENGGLTSTELAEHALDLLFKEYGYEG